MMQYGVDLGRNCVQSTQTDFSYTLLVVEQFHFCVVQGRLPLTIGLEDLSHPSGLCGYYTHMMHKHLQAKYLCTYENKNIFFKKSSPFRAYLRLQSSGTFSKPVSSTFMCLPSSGCSRIPVSAVLSMGSSQESISEALEDPDLDLPCGLQQRGHNRILF